jgi:hypothetical protein
MLCADPLKDQINADLVALFEDGRPPGLMIGSPTSARVRSSSLLHKYASGRLKEV